MHKFFLGNFVTNLVMLLALSSLLFLMDGVQYTGFRVTVAEVLFGVAVCQFGFAQALTKSWAKVSHQRGIGIFLFFVVMFLSLAYAVVWQVDAFMALPGSFLLTLCLCLMACSALRAGVLQNESKINRMLIFQNAPKTLLFACSPLTLINYNIWIATSSFFILILWLIEFSQKRTPHNSNGCLANAPEEVKFASQVTKLLRDTAAPAVILISTVIGQHFEFLTSSLADSQVSVFDIGFARVSLIFSFLASLMFYLQNKAVSETIERTLTMRTVAIYTSAALLVVIIVFGTLLGAAVLMPELSEALYLEAAPMAFALVFIKSTVWCSYFISGSLLYYLGFSRVSVVLCVLPLVYAALPLTGFFESPSMKDASITLIFLMIVNSIVSNFLITKELKGNALGDV